VFWQVHNLLLSLNLVLIYQLYKLIMFFIHILTRHCEYVSVISNDTQPPQLTEHHLSVCLKWWCFWFVFGSHPVWIMDKTLTILPEGSYSFSSVLPFQHRNSTLERATTTSFHILSNYHHIFQCLLSWFIDNISKSVTKEDTL
jgi:hypothetical protein